MTDRHRQPGRGKGALRAGASGHPAFFVGAGPHSPCLSWDPGGREAGPTERPLLSQENSRFNCLPATSCPFRL